MIFRALPIRGICTKGTVMLLVLVAAILSLEKTSAYPIKTMAEDPRDTFLYSGPKESLNSGDNPYFSFVNHDWQENPEIRDFNFSVKRDSTSKRSVAIASIGCRSTKMGYDVSGSLQYCDPSADLAETEIDVMLRYKLDTNWHDERSHIHLKFRRDLKNRRWFVGDSKDVTMSRVPK